MAALLLQFDFRASNRDEQAWADKKIVAEQFHLKDHVTGQKDGPMIEFRLRKIEGHGENDETLSYQAPN